MLSVLTKEIFVIYVFFQYNFLAIIWFPYDNLFVNVVR